MPEITNQNGLGLDMTLDPFIRMRRPIELLLWCPQCAEQHIDAPNPLRDWKNPPHCTHECQACGYLWRVCDQPTRGVALIMTKGGRDQDPRPLAARQSPEPQNLPRKNDATNT